MCTGAVVTAREFGADYRNVQLISTQLRLRHGFMGPDESAPNFLPTTSVVQAEQSARPDML